MGEGHIIYSRSPETPFMHFTPLSDSLMLPLKQFWYCSDGQRALIDSRQILQPRILPALSPLGPHWSLLSMALCPQVVPQARQPFRFVRCQPLTAVALPSSLAVCLAECRHARFSRSTKGLMVEVEDGRMLVWTSRFRYCRRILKSVRTVVCVVWLSLLGAVLTVLPG